MVEPCLEKGDGVDFVSVAVAVPIAVVVVVIGVVVELFAVV